MGNINKFCLLAIAMFHCIGVKDIWTVTLLTHLFLQTKTMKHNHAISHNTIYTVTLFMQHIPQASAENL